jgi:glycosyltransferase involved in cell wall biosynthesis
MSRIKVWISPAQENWICDRFLDEWSAYAPTRVVKHPADADVLWVLAGWKWNQVHPALLASKKVVVTQHHIVPDKFDQASWDARDLIVDAYHVPCQKTYEQVREHTDKPIHVIPFWVNQHIWRPLDRDKCREKHALPLDRYLVGSFQRDTEGSDLKTPKLEKGPDIFCDVVEKMAQSRDDLEVVLAGWRRQYVKRRLDAAGIRYHYFDRPTQEYINDLYNALDLYIVSSRYEGGPQAIVECALTETPIVSTDVGIASEILAPSAIYKTSPGRTKTDEAYARSAVRPLEVPQGFDPFVKMLTGMVR